MAKISDINQLLEKKEHDVIAAYSPGFNRKPSFGESPAVVAIDFTKSFLGVDAPISESIRTWPLSAGEAAWKAVRNAAKVIRAARAASVPIYYTIPELLDASSGFGSKTFKGKDASPLVTVAEEIAPKPGDHLVRKFYPSGFFGTNMASLLVRDGIDTLVIMGGTTSGCVRATVVDASSYHYHVVIVEDAVFDRINVSSIVSLFDLRLKYADIATTKNVLNYLGKLKRTPKPY